jgi:twinkle protein
MNSNEISEALARVALDVCTVLLPNGKRKNNEFCAGSVDGEEGDSLRVHLKGSKAGVWADFNSGQKGDILDLIAQVKRCSISDAMKHAIQFIPQQRNYDNLKSAGIKRTYKKPKQIKESDVELNPDLGKWLRSRGLAARIEIDYRLTLKKEVFSNKECDYILAFPFIRDGETVNIKHRSLINKRKMFQEKDAEPCLFGWHLISPLAREICITEGEVDAMTLHQMGFAALSVPSGAGSHQWIDNDWERLEAFSTIYLCFDNDETGQKGVIEVAKRLGIDRCRLVKFTEKDANEALVKGATRADFQKAMDESKYISPAQLKPMAEFWPAVIDAMCREKKEENPLLKITAHNYDFFAFRPGEVSIWTGYNGHGKSLLLIQAMIGLMEQGKKICVFSGEMPPITQGQRLARQLAGTENPTENFLEVIGDWLSDKFWLFDMVGSASMTSLIEAFTYAYKRHGVEHFVVDSLMMTDVPEDGFAYQTKQREGVSKLTTFCKSYGCHVHLVAHPKKGNREKPPEQGDVCGSGKITDFADNIFSLWSDFKKQGTGETDVAENRPDAWLTLMKQRNASTQVKKIPLYFNLKCQQFSHDRLRRPYIYQEFKKSMMGNQMNNIEDAGIR